MFSTRLVTESGLAPRGNGTGTADRRLAFTAAVGVVVRVHDGAADRGTDAHVTRASGFTYLDVDVILVAHGADGSHTIGGNVAKLTRGKAEKRIFAFFSHELCGVACGSCHLTASAGIKLNVVNERTGGDVCKRESIAGLDVGICACDDLVAYRKTGGSKDVALYAVLIPDESNKCGTVGIVLYCFYLREHTDLVSLIVDNAVFNAVSAAVMANGDSAVGVSAGSLFERLKKASFGSDL